MNKKIAVLGAGLVGHAIVKDLAKDKLAAKLHKNYFCYFLY